MTKRRGSMSVILTVLLAAVAVPPVARGAENVAAERIEAMANFLAKAQRVSVSADCTYDVVQDDGQKIEFGERREVKLRRPDRVRFEVARRDGGRRGLVFDGAQLAAFDVEQKVYATVAKPGTADAALNYYAQDLNMRLPLRELFAADLPQKLKGDLASARLVGKETIGGVATDHVAFRGDTADVQAWIARDGDPLLQRLVITYRMAAGQPQFAADFHGWSFSADVPDATFTFVPAEGARKIPILEAQRKSNAGEKRP
jgi:hypothetical protein